jgi:hypothetical protein
MLLSRLLEPPLEDSMVNCRIARIFLVLISAALWVGCKGDSAGRHAITGTVNLDGSPLAKGMISFQPLENGRLSSGAVIAEGKFSIPADKGLPVGKYRVEVHAGASGGPAVDSSALPGEGPPPSKDIIPPDWGEASKQTIEVKKEGPFNFAFEIATKGK